MDDITVVLGGWRRPRNIQPILEAICAQSVRPRRIAVWRDHYDGPELSEAARVELRAAWKYTIAKLPPGCEFAGNEQREGVWSRFRFADRITDTRFVCIFDDDTIPGRRWLEHCLQLYPDHPGVLGAHGIIFGLNRQRRESKRYGWMRPGSGTVRCDKVGCSWFFTRDLLTRYIAEMANFPCRPTCGEDYHASYVAQLCGLHTYCPDHPRSDSELWGSLRAAMGRDSVALWKQRGEEAKKLQAHNEYLDAGWRLLRASGEHG